MSSDTSHSGIDAELAPNAYLMPDSSDALCQPMLVTPKRATVGRSSYNTIVLPTNTVSRKHAIMISKGGIIMSRIYTRATALSSMIPGFR